MIWFETLNLFKLTKFKIQYNHTEIEKITELVRELNENDSSGTSREKNTNLLTFRTADDVLVLHSETFSAKKGNSFGKNRTILSRLSGRKIFLKYF